MSSVTIASDQHACEFRRPWRNLVECLKHWAQVQPDACLWAFWDADGHQASTYTYAQLDARTRCLAHHLSRTLGIATGERVLLAYPAGLEFGAAFVACARVGIIPVPVCPPSRTAAIESKILAVADDCKAAVILTTTAVLNSLGNRVSADVDVAFRRFRWVTTDDVIGPTTSTFVDSPGSTLFLQYTSGSTTSPRGVIVTHQNVINNALATLDHRPIGVSWLPHYHDMGLIGYGLYPIVTGGAAHSFSPLDFLRRPSLWFELVTRVKATCTSSPNFGLEYCLREDKIRPDDLMSCDLSSLRFLMNAAEPVSARTHRKFLETFARYGLRPTAHIVSYGLAENTLAATHGGRRALCLDRAALQRGRVVDRADDERVDHVKIVSCGAPLQGVCVRIVDPAASETVRDRHVGEIWIAGSSVCDGYWQQPELTKRTFDNVLEQGGEHFLRTGDLGFLDRGELFVCGRTKDVIVRRGRNYYPHDIEHEVALVSDKIRQGGVAAIAGETDASLVVIVEARRSTDLPDPAEIARAVAVSNGLVADRITITKAGAIARTTSGKISRARTRQRWLDKKVAELSSYVPLVPRMDRTELISPRERILETLSRWVTQHGDDCTLAEAGIDSLTLVNLVLDLEQLVVGATGCPPTAVDGSLVHGCTVSQLRGLVERCESSPREAWSAVAQVMAAIKTARHDSERSRMRRDAVLSLPMGSVDPPSPAPSNGKVLLTGATGFFGPFLLSALLEQTSSTYYVLMRTGDSESGLERIRDGLRRALLWSPEIDGELTRRVFIVPGDISQPNLDLTAAAWGSLARSVDAVIHNAAAVNYVAPYNALRATNVEGTRELLRLSSEVKRKEFHHISSTVIFGWTPSPEVTETECNAAMEYLEFGYAQSKWVAEQLVLGARQQGVSTFVYRPAFVSASTNGIANKDDIVVRLLAFMINKRIAVNAGNQVSFLPADIVAQNIAAIIRDPNRPLDMLHITADSYYNMVDVTEMLSNLYGYTFQYFDISDFVIEMRRRCERNDPMFPLLDFFTRFHDRIAAMKHKRYSNFKYRMARDQAASTRHDPSLQETVMYLRNAMLREQAICY